MTLIKQTYLMIIFLLIGVGTFAQENLCWSIDYETWDNNGQPSLFINCGNDPAFNAGEEITIELWARAYTFAENRKILGKIVYHDPIDNGYVLGFENLHVYGEYFNPTLQQVPRPDDGPMPPDSSFVHIVSTYSSITGNVKSFVNGILAGETSMFPSDPIVDNDAPFIIGNAPWDTYSFQFYGDLDEVRIWDQEKTQQEIQALMHVELSGSEEGLVAYYNFNDASEGNVPDKSSNGFDGTLENYDHISTTWGISGAPVGDATMATMLDVDAIWYRNTENYHKLITDNGIIIIGNIPEKAFEKYLVAGYNGLSGVTSENEPTTNPAGFQRSAREWYINCAGSITGGLTLTLDDAAIDNGFPLDAEMENYALLYRENENDPYTTIRTPTSPYDGILQFNVIHFESGYYAIGYSTEEFEIQDPNAINDAIFEDVTISPNPTHSVIKINGTPRNTRIEIYNIVGHKEYSQTLDETSNEIDISEFNQGIYIIKTQYKKSISTYKVIKNQ